MQVVSSKLLASFQMVKVFKYIEPLDCFIIEAEYKRIASLLGLVEWNEVVWIGRYLLLDNDNGEHWFDNWDLREQLEETAKLHGLECENLMIIDPQRFKNNFDGPCHTDIERKRFWTDILKSLHLSYETLFEEARKVNDRRSKADDDYIINLEEQIEFIKTTCF